jgi:hypothetical protein
VVSRTAAATAMREAAQRKLTDQTAKFEADSETVHKALNNFSAATSLVTQALLSRTDASAAPMRQVPMMLITGLTVVPNEWQRTILPLKSLCPRMICLLSNLVGGEVPHAVLADVVSTLATAVSVERTAGGGLTWSQESLIKVEPPPAVRSQPAVYRMILP